MKFTLYSTKFVVSLNKKVDSFASIFIFFLAKNKKFLFEGKNDIKLVKMKKSFCSFAQVIS